MKYPNYIGVGDSKTFRGILDSEPYDDFIVSKKECIDHVQKRMCIRNLKNRTKRLGGKEKLTGKLIDELSLYYGLAICRNHDSVEKMRNEIFATLSQTFNRRAPKSTFNSKHVLDTAIYIAVRIFNNGNGKQ